MRAAPMRVPCVLALCVTRGDVRTELAQRGGVAADKCAQFARLRTFSSNFVALLVNDFPCMSRNVAINNTIIFPQSYLITTSKQVCAMLFVILTCMCSPIFVLLVLFICTGCRSQLVSNTIIFQQSYLLIITTSLTTQHHQFFHLDTL